MTLEALATRLTGENHIGMTDSVRQRLKLGDADVTRGRLMAQAESNRNHLGVYLLAAYVVDDTDLWGDGEIYWWSIPTIVNQAGQVVREPLHGLPNAAKPHRTGSLEWMTNLSLKDPPLLAIIPPEEDVAACTLRLAFYDDDKKPADVPAAMEKALEAYAEIADVPLSGPDQIITPVRTALWEALVAKQDDVLIDQDVTILRGEAVPFSNGMLGSIMNAKVRVYYFVKDESDCEVFGPVVLHKGQSENVKFNTPLKAGGRLALFSRGAPVSCATFGELNLEMPFQNRVLTQDQAQQFAQGFSIAATGPAKFVAYYTPPA